MVNLDIVSLSDQQITYEITGADAGFLKGGPAI